MELVRGGFENANTIDGLRWLHQAAKQDKPEAWFTIGIMLKDGVLVSQDYQEASKMFAKAANSGHTNAQLELDNLYLRGLGVIQSNEKVLNVCWRASENGSTNACFDIGLGSRKGEGVEVENLTGDTKLADEDRQENQLTALSTDEPISNKNSIYIAIKSKPLLAHEIVSTSTLGRIVGIKAKPFLFDEFQRKGYIEKIHKRYCLTDFGKSNDVGGRYELLQNGVEVVAWPIVLGTSLSPLKKSLLDDCVDFRLFHMTHVDNITSIIKSGILSHNTAPKYVNISNHSVNSRRERSDPVHKKSLHYYVPLYFNPRNAMLYEKQKEYGSEIVILEVARRVCLSNYILFSKGNAATKSASFVYCLSDVREFDWPKIQSRDWAMNGIVNVDIKQLMMSECLVYSRVDTQNLIAVHTVNNSMSSRLQSMLGSAPYPSIRTSSDLFFPKQ